MMGCCVRPNTPMMRPLFFDGPKKGPRFFETPKKGPHFFEAPKKGPHFFETPKKGPHFFGSAAGEDCLVQLNNPTAHGGAAAMGGVAL